MYASEIAVLKQAIEILNRSGDGRAVGEIEDALARAAPLQSGRVERPAVDWEAVELLKNDPDEYFRRRREGK